MKRLTLILVEALAPLGLLRTAVRTRLSNRSPLNTLSSRGTWSRSRSGWSTSLSSRSTLSTSSSGSTLGTLRALGPLAAVASFRRLGVYIAQGRPGRAGRQGREPRSQCNCKKKRSHAQSLLPLVAPEGVGVTIIVGPVTPLAIVFLAVNIPRKVVEAGMQFLALVPREASVGAEVMLRSLNLA